jgi:hypothetical protein
VEWDDQFLSEIILWELLYRPRTTFPWPQSSLKLHQSASGKPGPNQKEVASVGACPNQQKAAGVEAGPKLQQAGSGKTGPAILQNKLLQRIHSLRSRESPDGPAAIYSNTEKERSKYFKHGAGSQSCVTAWHGELVKPPQSTLQAKLLEQTTSVKKVLEPTSKHLEKGRDIADGEHCIVSATKNEQHKEMMITQPIQNAQQVEEGKQALNQGVEVQCGQQEKAVVTKQALKEPTSILLDDERKLPEELPEGMSVSQTQHSSSKNVRCIRKL